MDRRLRDHHFTHVIAIMLISSVLFCACQTISTEPVATTEKKSTEITLYPDSSSWSFEAEGAETMPISSDKITPDDTDDDARESSEGSSDAGDTNATSESTAEPTFNTGVESVGEGSYTFMIGNTKFHSSTDVSMLIKPEDGSVYDFGARECACSWIDASYVRDIYSMKTYDSSYRYLGYYNNEMSVNFNPYKEIGEWKSPKGHNFSLYLVEILIISHNLEIRILPKETNSYDVYNVSVNGRGYYASKDQLQMMDFVLSLLAKKPYVDPLEGLYTGTDHKYYF